LRCHVGESIQKLEFIGSEKEVPENLRKLVGKRDVAAKIPGLTLEDKSLVATSYLRKFPKAQTHIPRPFST